MPSNQDPSSVAINDFKKEFAAFQVEHAAAIAQVEAAITRTGSDNEIEEMLWGMVDDLKGLLGSAAANNSSDSAGDQEYALASVESWVSSNTPPAVPLILWMRGVDVGSAEIVAELKAG